MLEQIYSHADRSPQKIAIADDKMQLAYGDLPGYVDRIARGLHQAGLGPGHRLLYLDSSRTGYLTTLLACMQTGITLVPTSPQAPQAWRQRLIAEFNVNAFAEGVGDLIKGKVSQVSNVQSDGPGDIIAILTTSGTTGAPKGVPIHSGAVEAAVENTINAFFLDRTTDFLNYVPPFTVGGMFFTGLPLLIAGSSNWLQTFSPFHFASHIAQRQPTHSLLLPAMISLLRTSSNWPELDLSCLKYVGSGASPVSEGMANELLDRGVGHFLHLYGLTECLTPVMGHASVPSLDKKIIFSAMYGDYQMKLAQDGELLLSGSAITRGYLGDPAMNAEAFEGEWFKTGDLFESEGATWRFVDRKKQVLKIGGFSVFPVLTESTIMDLDGIRNCCAVAGTTPSGFEELAVVIEGDTTDRKAILQYCHEKLPRHQIPRRVIFMDRIPVNAMGKTDRNAITQLIAST